MRAVVFSALLVLPVLAACASSGKPSSYQADLDALEARCTERQGILAATGAQTGRPETEYVCKITGGATRIPSN